jgi:putative hydrolase of the HAD superfamily
VIEVIAFDADDTLWETEQSYQEAENLLKSALSRHCDEATIKRRLRETLEANYRCFGFNFKGFALSMIELAVSLSNGRTLGSEIQAIIDMSKGILTSDVQLKHGAAEALAHLGSKYDLMLISMGDPAEQQSKLRRSGLSTSFRRVELGAHKSEAYYRTLFAEHEIRPSRFLMVGDSLEHDILPVLALGGRAVYVPSGPIWWHDEEVDEEVDTRMIERLDSLGELPAYVERLCRS